MPWSEYPFTEIVIPGDAGPGDARIVITGELPPPLDTYTFTDQAGYGASYSGAIIFYAGDDTPPLDDTYTYLAVVNNGISAFSAVHMGHVQNGSVRQVSPGVPEVQIWGTEGSSVATQKWLTAGLVEIMSTQGTGHLRLRAVDEIRIQTDAAFNGGQISISAPAPLSTVTVSAAAKVQMQNAANDARIFVDNTPNVEGFSLGDTRWQGFGNFIINFLGEIRFKSTRAYLMTQIQTNLQTGAGDLTLTAAAQNVPGCSITLPTVSAGARYECEIVCDFDRTVAGAAASTAFGQLLVDGVLQTQTAKLRTDLVASGGRASVTAVYSGTLAAAGNHTFTLQALLDVVNGTVVSKTGQTHIRVKYFESG